MTVDPRSLIYPGHDEREQTTGTKEELEPDPTPDADDRRTGTNEELKELDRVERRKE